MSQSQAQSLLLLCATPHKTDDSGTNIAYFLQATNAIRRLRAYAGLSGPVDIGQGGSPNFLDIMRVFFAMQQDVAHENIVKLLKPGECQSNHLLIYFMLELGQESWRPDNCQQVETVLSQHQTWQ